MIDRFHPLVREWFASRYGEPTEPQVCGWPAIAAGNDVLISAPTGSGKTLAAFSICLDDLVRRAAANELPDHTLVVYVSPLKALTNDVRKNLELPLAELLARSRESKAWRSRRSAPRCAPATRRRPNARACCASRRTCWSRRPSRSSSCSPPRSRARSSPTSTTVIVDEIHAMARDKRGSHLALTLARLDRIWSQRAGGTKAAAHRPFGDGAPARRRRAVLEPERARSSTSAAGARWTIAVEVPSDELGPVASGEMWGEIYDRVARLDPRQPHDAGLRRHAAHERTRRLRA